MVLQLHNQRCSALIKPKSKFKHSTMEPPLCMLNQPVSKTYVLFRRVSSFKYFIQLAHNDYVREPDSNIKRKALCVSI